MPTNQDPQSQLEQQTKQGYKVRQVTHYQPSWQEKQRGEAGNFYVQLILDHGRRRVCSGTGCRRR